MLLNEKCCEGSKRATQEITSWIELSKVTRSGLLIVLGVPHSRGAASPDLPVSATNRYPVGLHRLPCMTLPNLALAFYGSGSWRTGLQL